MLPASAVPDPGRLSIRHVHDAANLPRWLAEKSSVRSTCGAVFSDAIVDDNPDAKDRQFVGEVFRIQVLLAIIEGRLEPAEIATIQRLYKELAGNESSREGMENEVRRAYEGELDAAEMVHLVGRSLGGEGARIVAQHAYQVAVATGTVSKKRQAQVDRFPAWLGISAAGFQELIDRVLSPTTHGISSRTREPDNQEHQP